MAFQRKQRCETQKIFLLEAIQPNADLSRTYMVCGSTGNIYQVTIAENPSCTCPDNSKNNNRCKHIYFILMKVMKTEDEDESQYSPEDLQVMFNNIPVITNQLMADNNIRTIYDKLKISNGLVHKEKDITKKGSDDLCPICLDELDNGEDLDYCKFSCGKQLHKLCFSMWIKQKKEPICVYCKAHWVVKKQSYVNVMDK